MEEEQQKDGNGYKIKCGKEYTLQRQDFNGKSYYSISVSKKKYDGTVEFAKKMIKFVDLEKKGLETDFKDKTIIKFNNFFEDWYYAKTDTKKYNPIYIIVATDWTVIRDAQEVSEAYENFMSVEDTELPF